MFLHVWKKKKNSAAACLNWQTPKGLSLRSKLKSRIEAYLRSEDNDDTEKISTHKHYKIGQR